MRIPKIIYQPLIIKCDKCNKTIIVDVPYKYISSETNKDIYAKDRLDKLENLCDCNEIDHKIVEEYQKLKLNFIIKY